MKLNKDILTAKIQKVNKWTKAPSKKAKTAKQIRMSILVANIGDVFYDEFSAQKQNVVDEIVYKSVETGVYTAHVDTLRKNVIKVETGQRGIGQTTVKATVKLLRTYASQEFYIGQVGSGNAGAYVFVDLRHPKAPQIMAHLFGLMVATTGVDNTNNESLNDHDNDHKHDSLSDNKNVTGTNTENPVAPVVEEVPADNEKQQKSESPSFSSFSLSFKDLKPKQEAPVNLYGKVCKLLKVVGRNSLVTKLVRLAEKAKKDIINFTDDHFMYALNESVNYNANDLEAYTASIIYNTASTRKESVEEHAVPVSLQQQDNRPQTRKEVLESEIESLEQQNKEYAHLHATKAPNEWLYPGKIEKNNERITKLKEKLAKFENEQPITDFEAEKARILASLGM